MLLETCEPLQQSCQLRAGRAAARGEAAAAHAGQEARLQRPADGGFRVGGDLRAVGKGVQRRGGGGIFAGQGRVAAQDGAQLLARDGRVGLEAGRGSRR